MERTPRIKIFLQELDKKSKKDLETNKIVQVLAWLNGTIHQDIFPGAESRRPQHPSSARIEAVFKLLKTLELDAFDGKTGDKRTITKLNSLLRQYTLIFTCNSPSAINEKGPRISLKASSGSIEATREADVIQSMVEVFGSGLLNRIVRCVCGRWYFVKKRDHTSCSIGCRKRKYESTPEYKKAKAERVRLRRSMRK